MLRPVRPILLLFALLALACPARAAVRINPLHNDNGVYRVYFQDRLLGTETFSLEPRGDSVLVFSSVDEKIPTPRGDEPLKKKAELAFKTLDYDIAFYTSEQDFLGKKLVRGLSPHDTTLTSYREDQSFGGGDTFRRPPGRLFVIDSQVFVLFDVMLRSLHGAMMERPLTVMILGDPRDTIMTISCEPGATENVQVQGKAYPALRVAFSDGTSTFDAWVAKSGQMLRLDQPAAGMRVERVSLVAKKVPNPALKKPPAEPAVEPGAKITPPKGSSP